MSANDFYFWMAYTPPRIPLKVYAYWLDEQYNLSPGAHEKIWSTKKRDPLALNRYLKKRSNTC